MVISDFFRIPKKYIACVSLCHKSPKATSKGKLWLSCRCHGRYNFLHLEAQCLILETWNITGFEIDISDQFQIDKQISLFCAHALYKISCSWLKWFSSFNTNKRSNGQVRGITLPTFYRIQSKIILTWILNNLLNFRILAQANLYILCWQGFSVFIKAKSKKGHNSINA